MKNQAEIQYYMVNKDKVMRRISLRIMPFICLCYLFNYLDRANISFAALTMNQELGITPLYFGWIVGAFFVGYCLSEIPSNLAMQRYGARIWIARIMITWGIITIVCAFARTPFELLVARFFLGVAEGGFSPGIFLYLSSWFPSQWRAKAMATFLLGVPVSAVIGGPLSSAILSLHGSGGLSAWQWLFLIEGAPAILLGVLCLFILINDPRDAKWLSNDEKAWIAHELSEEKSRIESNNKISLRQVFSDTRVLLLCGVYLFGLIGLNGVYYWMPQIISSFGANNIAVGFIAVIPQLCGAIAMIVWARRSDATGKRIWHVGVGCLVGAAGMVVAGFLGNPVLVMGALTIALIGAYMFLATFWALPPAFLTGRAAAGGFALILTIGNTSGMLGPYIVGWVKQSTQSYGTSLVVLSAFLLLAAILTFVFARQQARIIGPFGKSAPHSSSLSAQHEPNGI